MLVEEIKLKVKMGDFDVGDSAVRTANDEFELRKERRGGKKRQKSGRSRHYRNTPVGNIVSNSLSRPSMRNNERIVKRVENKEIVMRKVIDISAEKYDCRKTACNQFCEFYEPKLVWNTQIHPHRDRPARNRNDEGVQSRARRRALQPRRATARSKMTAKSADLPLIHPRLRLSNLCYALKSDAELAREGVTAIIFLCETVYQGNADVVRTRHAPMTDSKNIPFSRFNFEVGRALGMLNEELERNDGRVVVCCKAGVNRSSAVAIAYAVALGQMNVDDCIVYIEKSKGYLRSTWDTLVNQTFVHHLMLMHQRYLSALESETDEDSADNVLGEQVRDNVTSSSSSSPSTSSSSSSIMYDEVDDLLRGSRSE